MLNPPQLDGSPRLTPRSERDSRHLNLVMALEQELGVSFSPDDIAKMTSVGAIIGAVEAGQG